MTPIPASAARRRVALISAVLSVTLALAACTFPKNTHLVRQPQALWVDGQRQAPLGGPSGVMQAHFAVDGAGLVVDVNGGRLVSTEVRLLFVAPVTERIDGKDETGPLTVAVQLRATQPWRHRLDVIGSVRDASGVTHGTAVVGVVEGLCEAYAKAQVRPLPDRSLIVPAQGRICLFLRYGVSPPLDERLRLTLGTLTVEEPGAPARRHAIEVDIASTLTDRLNGH